MVVFIEMILRKDSERKLFFLEFVREERIGDEKSKLKCR